MTVDWHYSTPNRCLPLDLVCYFVRQLMNFYVNVVVQTLLGIHLWYYSILLKMALDLSVFFCPQWFVYYSIQNLALRHLSPKITLKPRTCPNKLIFYHSPWSMFTLCLFFHRALQKLLADEALQLKTFERIRFSPPVILIIAI